MLEKRLTIELISNETLQTTLSQKNFYFNQHTIE
jgi:hypothetical protein